MLKLAVFRDVTERKEAEEKLREINRELDAFVSTVAHDLRTPLTPIIAYADLLREEYGARMEASALEMIGEIEKQGQRLLDLLEDLLVLARVGHLQHPETPVDTTAVIKEVLEEFAETIEKDHVTVEIRPLPPLSIPETLLFQVFANLIGNALRYAGGPGARIEVGGTAGIERARLFVRDHGPGIPTEERQRIFDPFYRAASSRRQQGTGIGLAIVRKVVRLYGGRIEVENTPGGGATFRFDLPLHHRPPVKSEEPHCFSSGS